MHGICVVEVRLNQTIENDQCVVEQPAIASRIIVQGMRTA